MKEGHLLIDGQNIAHIVHGIHMYRSGQDAEELKAPNGQYTTILKGTLNMIGGMLTQFGPQHIIVAYDGKTPSWRYDKDPTYKGGIKPRSGRSPFGIQINEMAQHLEAFGIKTIQSETLEADDIVALLAENKDLQDKQKVLVSDDRDLLAYVSPKSFYYSPKVKKLVAPVNFDEYTQTIFKVKQSVGTEGWPLFRALAGDTSDNIKGVPSCGPAYAAEIVNYLKESGANLSGYNQDFSELLPQLEGCLPDMPKKLKSLLTPSGLKELEHCYDLVRVANAPESEKQAISNLDCTTTQADPKVIQDKLKELGFKQWQDSPSWIQKFVVPHKELDLGI